MIMDFYNQSHQLGYEFEKEKKNWKIQCESAHRTNYLCDVVSILGT